jgi:hypothetical protein
MTEIRAGIAHRRVNSAAIPEEFPLLRTLQFAVQYWGTTVKVGDKPGIAAEI